MISSEKFEYAHDELDSIIEEVTRCLSRVHRSADERHDSRRQAQRRLAEAKKIVEDMDKEAKMAPISYRGNMMLKVRQGRDEIAKLQLQIRKLDEKEREELLSRAEAGALLSELSEEEQRRHEIAEGARILDQTTQSIVRSTQVALETEQVGEEIVSNLGVQRETLQRARSRLQETDAELTMSRRALRRLYFGIVKNKVVLILIIIVQLLILAGLIYYKFFSK